MAIALLESVTWLVVPKRIVSTATLIAAGEIVTFFPSERGVLGVVALAPIGGRERFVIVAIAVSIASTIEISRRNERRSRPLEFLSSRGSGLLDLL